jgi:hypothetical protein
MRLYVMLIRLAILATLVATAAICGGWKWDVVPH